MSEVVARRLVVRGRVQGVFFRASMRMEAEAAGVTGWVRNRRDGTVEALVQGPADAVDAITRWARRGPDTAEVEAVEVHDAAAEPTAGFETRPTA